MGAKSPRRRSVKRGKGRGGLWRGFTQYDHGEPIKAIDTRPMAFVFGLVALVMIAAEPVPTHALLIDLRQTPSQPLSKGYFDDFPESNPDSITNEVVVTPDDRVLWNCEQVTWGQLVTLLHLMEEIEPTPKLLFEPDPNVNYGLAARLLQIFKAVDVSNLKIGGIENHQNFDSATVARFSNSPGDSNLSVMTTMINLDFDGLPSVDDAIVAKCPNLQSSN